MNAIVALADPAVVTKQIDMLVEYFAAELEPHVLRLYVDSLRDIPEDDLRAGCRRVIVSARFMPKVAEIRAAVDAELRDRRLLEAPPRDCPPDRRFCVSCQDTGWAGIFDGTDPIPTVRRCPCYQTNPELARQRTPATYDKSEAR